MCSNNATGCTVGGSFDAVNGFLFLLPKLAAWNKDIFGLWENSPIQAVDLTKVGWQK